jgi:hypothetical protein
MDTQAIMAELSTADRLPRAALRLAGEHRAELAPRLLGGLEAYLADPSADDASSVHALFYAFHLFGHWRETSAYRPLARLLRLPEDDLEAILGEAVTETAHRVMAAVFDGDPEPLFDIILDPAAGQFARSSICDTLVMLLMRGQLERQQLEPFLREAFIRIEPKSKCFVWCGWMQAIARSGFAELTPLVEQAFAEGRIDPDYMSFSEHLAELAKTLENPGAPPWHDDTNYAEFGDVLSELERWHMHDDAVGSSGSFLPAALAERLMLWDLASRPASNPLRVIGRNDACPCGSGKKYKKCCLN